MGVSLILNRKAGTGQRGRYLDLISDTLKDQLTIYETTSKGDATSIAKRILNSRDRYIMVAGGDGTLNETIQPLVGSYKIVVPVPIGTGSDFCKAIGILSVEDSLRALENGSVRHIDTVMARWKAGKRFFLNILEVGFGASVMKRVNSSRRTENVFIKSVFRELIHLKTYGLRYRTSESDEEAKVVEVIAANGKFFGGGLLASPKSSLDDGLMDIHIIRKVGMIKFVSNFKKLRDGSYIAEPYVINLKVDQISLFGDAPVEMDGENIGDLPLHLKVVPKSLLVAFPE